MNAHFKGFLIVYNYFPNSVTIPNNISQYKQKQNKNNVFLRIFYCLNIYICAGCAPSPVAFGISPGTTQETIVPPLIFYLNIVFPSYYLGHPSTLVSEKNCDYFTSKLKNVQFEL